MSKQILWRRWGKAAVACGIAATVWLAARSGAADAPATAPTTAPATEPSTTVPSTNSPAAPEADSGRSTVVRRGDLDLALDFHGVFEPSEKFEVRLHPLRYHDEFVVKHAIAPGTKVAKGDTLLELDSRKIELAIAAAQNDLRVAQANLAKAQEDVRLGQQADALAMTDSKQQLVDLQTQLRRWDEIDGELDLFASGMQAKIADYYVENAADELDQLKKMYKSEDLTNQTADIVMKRAVKELELEKDIAKINHGATERHEQFEAPLTREAMTDAVDTQNLGVSQLQATQTQGAQLRAAALATAQSAADEAQRNVDELNSDAATFTVASSIDGIVVYGNYDHRAWHEIDPEQLARGEKVQPDLVLMTVFEPGKLRLSVECPESQLGYFMPGMKLEVTPAAIPELTYEGICGVLPIVGEAQGAEQAFNVRVDLPGVDPRIYPGFSADVNLNAGKREKVLLVPATAVWRDKVWLTRANPGVKAGQPNAFIDEARTVVIGASDGQEVEIKSGLAEGDVILTQAKHASGGPS
jgi:HlyD family secretion protein